MQTPFRLNLSAAVFPLVSDFMGRSIVVPQYDENLRKLTAASTTGDTTLEAGIPQIYYGHNIVPTGQGFKSVAYSRIIRAPIPAVATFARMIPAKDPDENKAFIGITSDARIFIFAAGASAWVEVTVPIAGWTGTQVSYAYANGFTYLCLSLFNIYKVDVVNRTLIPVTLTGIVSNLIVGLTAAANYLIVHDAVTVYWSSATDPEDFVPSLITGAGSGVPQDVNGKIVCCAPYNNGFAVYTSTNIVLAPYSGNLRYPWVFKGALNSSGIKDIEQVSFDGDSASSYAWTSSGLLKIAAAGCTAAQPEVSDFLAGRIFEDFDDAAKILTRIYTTSSLLTKVAYVSARYLILSYGITSLTHAILYDTALNRTGKLKLNHVDCFEISTGSDAPTPWMNLTPNTWASYAGRSWQEFRTLSNDAADAKRTIGFLQMDGTVVLMSFDYGNFNAAACLILGKYQLTRNKMCTIQGYEVENIDQENPSYSTFIMTTLDGKNVISNVIPQTKTSLGLLRSYNTRISGENHSLVFQGSFNLVSIILTLTPAGRVR